jgi:glycosyltransferase involved in cell wall biosynthesis
VLEALLAGRPVLLTPAADPDGLVERYGAGFVMAPRPDSIARGLIDASRLDPVRLQQLSLRARRLVDREFRWEKTSKELLNEYRAVAVR